MLVKVLHASVAEGKDPKVEVQKRLINYRNTVHPSTGVSPASLMMGRTIRTKLPVYIEKPTSILVEEARAKDVATREARNKRANKDINDQVLLTQRKTVVKPPFDPLPYTVEKVGRDQVTIKRGRKELIRNKAQLKLLTPRPERLKVNKRIVLNPIVDISEDEDYDLEAIRRRYTSVVASGCMENDFQELQDDGAHITHYRKGAAK